MTSTDRAFIHAFQSTPGGEEPTVALGPNAGTRRPRRPLSEHLASRKAETAPSDAMARPFEPAICVDDLAWPDVAVRLAEIARSGLLDLIAASTARGAASDCPSLAITSTEPGVGATTTTLALAHLIGGLGGRVAVIDAGGGAAESLGIDLAPAVLDDTGLTIETRCLASRLRNTTIAACDLSTGTTKSVASALSRVAQQHDLLLIDAGPAGSPAAATAGSSRGVGTLLLDRAAGAPRVRGVALARLRAAGVEATGVVETLAD